MKSLSGKVAIVTGASSGIGRAVAERLADEGVIVVVNYNRSEDKAKEVVTVIQAKGGKALATQADMGQAYVDYFPGFIAKGIANGLLDERLQQFDLGRLAGALKAERDQLWAEAVAAYQDREAWWLTAEAEGALRDASDEFRVVDPWEASIVRWIEDRNPVDILRPVTTQRILVDVLGLRLPDVGQREAMRVAAIMKRIGWANRVARIEGGKLARVWEVGT